MVTFTFAPGVNRNLARDIRERSDPGCQVCLETNYVKSGQARNRRIRSKFMHTRDQVVKIRGRRAVLYLYLSSHRTNNGTWVLVFYITKPVY